MTQDEFNQLSTDLRLLAKNIPINWGAIQNNLNDCLLNMFQINSYTDLENAISSFDDAHKNYFRRRWYLWQCSKCDEYLFAINDNVSSNPNPRSQEYDIEFNADKLLRFDIKGTVIPKSMRSQETINELMDNPQSMINFFYQKQSTGIRNAIQNRLFVVHHSFVDEQREFYLRCAWGTKQNIYRDYSNRIDTKKPFFLYDGVKSDVIFIIEKEKNKVEYKLF